MSRVGPPTRIFYQSSWSIALTGTAWRLSRISTFETSWPLRKPYGQGSGLKIIEVGGLMRFTRNIALPAAVKLIQIWVVSRVTRLYQLTMKVDGSKSLRETGDRQ
jgi:hypothetical protein